jgi:hypothetical protein
VVPSAKEDPTKVPELVPTEIVPEIHDVVYEGISFTFDGAIAAEVMAQTIPATDKDEPPQTTLPRHIKFSFNGYALPDTFHEPRILVYPVAEFKAISEYTSKTIADLRQILAERPEAPKEIPFLPPFHAGQMMRTQIAYIDFQNGKGVRFLTQYAQAYLPINNHELFYTFQGLTSDGQYYVAAILPASHPILPADQMAYEGGDLDTLAQSFDTYIAEIEEQLNVQDASSFSPHLNLFDAMIRSLAVAPSQTISAPPTAEGADDPYPGWETYVDEDYGFAFRYPATWTLEQGPNLLKLSRGTLRLAIAFQHQGEQVPPPWTGMPAGDFESRGTMVFLEQEIEKKALVYEGKVKVLTYNAKVGDSWFSIRLDDMVTADYQSVELPERAQSETDQIVDSFERLMDEENETGKGWNTYMSEEFGYALMYPGECTVMGADHNEMVSFVGPPDNERWPWLEVRHFDSDFYHPPAGTDVVQWITESDHPYGEIGPEAEVAGLPTVHFVYKGGPGVPDSDYYLFIRGEQLFCILILHAGGQQDWELYNKFLQGFTFLERGLGVEK